MAKTVGDIIREQLGGRKFDLMTGANRYVDSDTGTVFRVPKAKDGINMVEITVTGADEYALRFLKLSGLYVCNVKTIKEIGAVQVGQLRETFTLHTSLII